MLEMVVFVSGGLVMVLEMTGSRILAPYLGTSLVVWTSLIGVVLAFMALGAWFGGRLADRTLSRGRLAAILAGAGLATGLTAMVHPLVGEAITQSVEGLHLATVMASTILLALPAMLFGMITPYIIRLRLSDLATSGSMVGRLYALSTAGSIAGTFLGGFVLIAWFGSTQILLGTGTAMVALSLVVMPKRPWIRAVFGGIMLVGACASASYGTSFTTDGKPSLVETAYNSLVITEGPAVDGRQLRFLATDPGKCQSAMYVNNPNELALSYTRFFALGPALVPHASRVLMLGGGGYSVPRWLLSGGSGLASARQATATNPASNPASSADGNALQLDVVELDPGMTAVAQERFMLPQDPRMRLFHEDARRFLNRNTQTYDLVFVDVFGSSYSIPFHVGTVEATKAMRRSVAPGGALIMNVISALEGEKGQVFRAIHGALSASFAEVQVFAVRHALSPFEVQNLILVALPEKDQGNALFQVPVPNVPGEAMTVPHMLARRVTRPVTRDVPPLTDAYAPVERYMLPMLKD